MSDFDFIVVGAGHNGLTCAVCLAKAGRRVKVLERRGMVGGDIFHGALHLDQLFSLRPIPGYADYRMPVSGVYLCGSGAHPGGGVTGLPGRNAARAILRG